MDRLQAIRMRMNMMTLNNRIYACSKYAVAAKEYDDCDSETTWENCTLRAWMKDVFIHELFTDEEEAQLLEMEYGDKISLLTEKQCRTINHEMSYPAMPTEYAKSQGVSYTDTTGYVSWWC